jgi:nucleotide-binding universal stress UspA family protein
LENIDDEIKTVIFFASMFDASVKVLHVIGQDSAKKIDGKQITDNLIEATGYSNISFHVSKNDHIADELDQFVIQEKADLLVLFTHKLDFYEKLFGRSVARHLAFHAQIPLLTFNRTMTI